MTKQKFWMGSAPASCDICSQKIVGAFVDGARAMGPWAMMCDACHYRQGKKLGTGFGQRYERQPDGRWLKTGG